jgi:hypothetical protein
VRWRHAYPDVNGQNYAYTAAKAVSAEATPEPAASHNTGAYSIFATPHSMAATYSAASPNTTAYPIFATPHSSTAAIVLS